MNYKFSYYINFGSGFERVLILEKKLNLCRRRDKDDLAIIAKVLDGSFILEEPYFTKIDHLCKYGQTNDVPIRIYENGDSDTGLLVYEGYMTKFNDFDYNSKKVTIKEFNTDVNFLEFKSLYDRSTYIFNNYYSVVWENAKPIYCNLSYSGKKITDNSINICTAINHMLQDYYGNALTPFFCDVSDFWFNPANALFDAKKYRIANLRDINRFGSGNASKISLKRFIEILRIMHKIFWYVDLGKIKFKTIYDLDTTHLDLSAELIHKKKKFLNYGLNVKSEGIIFNDNNTLTPDDRYVFSKTKVIYDGSSSKNIEHNLSEICTRYTEEAPVDQYNINGFFLAYVDPTTNKMISINQEGISSGYDNCKLSPLSLISENYTDYLYIDNENYKFCNIQAIDKPYHLAPFIEKPEHQLILPSIYNFIDSYVAEIESDNQKIVLVYEQNTDLDTGITTLKGFEFSNTKYKKDRVIIPPDPEITDEISLSVTQLFYNQNGSEQVVYVISNVPWAAAKSVSDITLSQESGGAGMTEVRVSLTSSSVQRYASVVFSTAQKNVTLTLIQSISIEPVDVITVTPGYIEVPFSESITLLTIKCTSIWSATGESWMHFSFNSGTGDGTITMTVDANSFYRTGYAVFTSGSTICRIYVQQRQNIVELLVAPENLNYQFYGETKTFAITTVGSWVAASSQAWCSIDKILGNGNDTITVVCAASLTARTAYINVSNGSVSKKVNIIQDGEPGSIVAAPSTVQFDKNGGSQNVVITSNVAWTVTCNAIWISASVIGGSGNGNFAINVGATSIARNSTITLTSGAITRTIIVGQSYVADLPTISVSPGYNNVGLGASQVTLTIVTTSGWSVTSKPSWVSFSSSSGAGNATITMYVDFAAAARSGNATFSIAGNLSSIYISQH